MCIRDRHVHLRAELGESCGGGVEHAVGVAHMTADPQRDAAGAVSYTHLGARCAICTRPRLHMLSREAARPRDIGQKRVQMCIRDRTSTPGMFVLLAISMLAWTLGLHGQGIVSVVTLPAMICLLYTSRCV